MILIISVDNDTSTNDVIDWLDYYGVNFIRLNASDILSDNEFTYLIGDSNSAIKILLKWKK